MRDQINVQNTRGVSDAQKPLEPGPPGSLNGDLDASRWVFTGNGVTTPTQVMTRVIELETKDGNEALKKLGTGQARNLAGFALQAQNPNLSSDPNKPVPNGEHFHLDLKALLAPYAKNLDKLRSDLESGAIGFGAGADNKATGQVRRNAASIRGLPFDPNI